MSADMRCSERFRIPFSHNLYQTRKHSRKRKPNYSARRRMSFNTRVSKRFFFLGMVEFPLHLKCEHVVNVLRLFDISLHCVNLCEFFCNLSQALSRKKRIWRDIKRATFSGGSVSNNYWFQLIDYSAF